MRQHESVASLGEKRIVTSGDDAKPVPGRTAPLWLAAAVLAATWTPQLQAQDLGRSLDTSARLAQVATGDPPGSRAAEGQDHQNAEMLGRELEVTRNEVDALLKLLNEQRDEIAEVRKALQGERDRASRLEQDLAARRVVETRTALAAKAGDEASQLKKTADAGTADLRKSLQQEHDRAGRLEQDLAAARRDLETQTALAAKAGDEASQLKKTADAGTADLRKSLQQEHDRAGRLEQDLAAARRDLEAQTALAAKAGDEASQLKKTADAGTADLRKSPQQEHDRANRLEQDLAAARRDVETQTALAAKAGDEASQLKKTADAGTADLRKSLQQEHDRANRLEQDLAAARRNVETQKVVAAKAGDETVRLKPGVESGSEELRQSLPPERDSKARPERDLALARSKENTRAPSVAVTSAINGQSEPEATAGLVARANVLLGRGDIGSARIVLERAAEAGNAEARFKLAETYDPFILSKWGTYGTRGDAMKAIDLYAKAQAGGIKEAKERLDALRP